MNKDPIPEDEKQGNSFVQQFADRKSRLEIDAAIEQLSIAQAMPIDEASRKVQEQQLREARLDLYSRLDKAQRADLARLSPEDAERFNTAQTQVTQDIADILTGKAIDSEVMDSFDSHERTLINRLKEVAENYRREHPNEPLNIGLTQQADRLLWITMIRREAFKRSGLDDDSPYDNTVVDRDDSDKLAKATDSQRDVSPSIVSTPDAPTFDDVPQNNEDTTTIPGIGEIWSSTGNVRAGSKENETETATEKQVREPFRHLGPLIASTDDTVRLLHSPGRGAEASILAQGLNLPSSAALESTLRPVSKDKNEALDNLLSPHEARPSAIVVAIPRSLYDQYKSGRFDYGEDDPLRELNADGDGFRLKKDFIEGYVDLRTKQFIKRQQGG